jgi:uncharacterized protein (TIGR02145 family)
MKKLFTLIALIVLTTINAQAPQGFNYQATVRNSSGALIINQNVTFKFNIMLNSQTSLPIYSETNLALTDNLGQVNLVIGQGSANTGTFTSINWANGNYYLGIELNTGTGYVAMGTTQLLSVPYALYANTAGNSQTSTPNLASVLAVNNGANNLQIKNLADPTDAQDAVTKGFVGSQFYTQAQVDNIVVGLQTQINNLQNSSPTYPLGTIHCNLSNPTAVVPVINSVTGKTWMDRNLGAAQVATSSTDSNAYGDLYQWGRKADIHQCRNSSTTTTLSSTDQPTDGHLFILSPNSPSDWRSPQNNNLWQGVNGVNNPCPIGYRIPTEAELDAERLSWTSNNIAGAFESPLKFTLGGNRSFVGGNIDSLGNSGWYWSSTVAIGVSYFFSSGLFISSSNSNINSSFARRASGFSVRCIKD